MALSRINRRSVFGLMGGAAAATTLAGCAGLTPQSNKTPAADPSTGASESGGAPAKVSGISIPDSPGKGNAAEAKALPAVRDYFASKYPQYEIKWEENISAPEMFAQIPTRLAGGTLPTAFRVPIAQAYLPIGRNQSGSIDDFVKDLPLYDKIIDALKDPLKNAEGKMCGFSPIGGRQGLNYNAKRAKELGFDGGPKNLDEWREMCAKMSDAGKGQYGFATYNGIGGGWIYVILAYGAGARIQVKDGDKWTTDLLEEPAMKTLRLLRDMRWEDKSLNPKFLEGKQFAEEMAAGRLGTNVYSFHRVKEVLELGASSGLKDGDIAITATPKEANGGSYFDADAWLFNPSQSDEQRRGGLTWAYTRYLDPEAWDAWCKAWTEGGGALDPVTSQELSLKPDAPERKDFAEINKKYSKLPLEPYAEYLGDGAPGAPDPPVLAGDAYGILGTAVEKILTDEKANVDEVMNTAAKEMQKLLDNAETK